MHGICLGIPRDLAASGSGVWASGTEGQHRGEDESAATCVRGVLIEGQ